MDLTPSITVFGCSLPSSSAVDGTPCSLLFHLARSPHPNDTRVKVVSSNHSHSCDPSKRVARRNVVETVVRRKSEDARKEQEKENVEVETMEEEASSAGAVADYEESIASATPVSIDKASEGVLLEQDNPPVKLKKKSSAKGGCFPTKPELQADVDALLAVRSPCTTLLLPEQT
jgi:hypothetical protein